MAAGLKAGVVDAINGITMELIYITDSQVLTLEIVGHLNVTLPSGNIARLEGFAYTGWHIWHPAKGWIGPFQDRSKAYDFMETLAKQP